MKPDSPRPAYRHCRPRCRWPSLALRPASRRRRGPGQPVDAAFQKFWDARSPAGRRPCASTPCSGPASAYDEALRRLKQGRAYTAQKTGVVMLTNKTEDKVEHYYAVNVPAAYDPARRYQVRFQLHGGVMAARRNSRATPGDIGALAGAEQIYVIPYGWTDAPWWSDDQVAQHARHRRHAEAHVQRRREPRRRVGRVRRRAPARTTSRCARRRRLRASCRSTASSWCSPTSELGIRGDLFPNNLRNKPLFVVNGGTRSAVSDRGGRAVRRCT